MQNAERDLQERTKRFALNIIRTFSMMPKTTEAQVLGKQLLRSGTSVGQIVARLIAAAARQHSSQSVVIRSASWKRPLTGARTASRRKDRLARKTRSAPA